MALVARSLEALTSRMLQIEATCTRAALTLSTKTRILHVNALQGANAAGIQLRTLTVDPVQTFMSLG